MHVTLGNTNEVIGSPV